MPVWQVEGVVLSYPVLRSRPTLALLARWQLLACSPGAVRGICTDNPDCRYKHTTATICGGGVDIEGKTILS